MNRFRSDIEQFKSVKILQDELLEMEMIFVMIEKFFEKKSSKSKEKFENSEFKIQLKKLFDEYNKTYFIYDQNLNVFLSKKT